MADYGGLGGLKETRPMNAHDAFEMAVNRALGDEMPPPCGQRDVGRSDLAKLLVPR